MRRRGRPRNLGLLTPREQELLDLLRAGLSNRESAERLGISLQGAKYHVTEILAKLGVASSSRGCSWSRLSAWARRCSSGTTVRARAPA